MIIITKGSQSTGNKHEQLPQIQCKHFAMLLSAQSGDNYIWFLYLVSQFLQRISPIFFNELIKCCEEVIRFPKQAFFLRDIPNVDHLVLYEGRSHIILVHIGCAIEVRQDKPANKDQFHRRPERKPVKVKHGKAMEFSDRCATMIFKYICSSYN